MVDWSRILAAFVLPLALWTLTFALLAIQLIFLFFFETRIASGLIEKKLLPGAAAILVVAATSQYDRGIAAPLLASFYPREMREQAQSWILFAFVAFSILMTGVAFHYSITHVTTFKGHSLLIFPPSVYQADPAAVRRLWIQIFNLVCLTSMVLVALLHVYLFSFARVFGKVNDAEVILAYIAGLFLVGVTAQPLRNTILRFPSNLVLIAKVNQILAQNAKSADVRRSLSARKSDPNSWARREPLYVSRMLERLARREDSVSGPDARHPLAAIYRAVADNIRQYCGSPKSLEGSLPSTLVSTLETTQGVMITGESVWRKQLVKRLRVFDANGKPRPLATAATPSGATNAIRIAGRQGDRVLVWIKDRWPAIVIVVGIVLAFMGVLDVKSLLDLKP